MQDVLRPLTVADYTFLVGLIDSNVNLTNDRKLHQLLDTVEEFDTDEARAALQRQLEREIRYLGSSELAYWGRYVAGQEPGVTFHEIVLDVAKKVKVDLPPLSTDRELVEELVRRYATLQFANLSPEQQQRMLEDLGVEQDRAAAFIKKSAGVFAIPALIQAFGTLVVNGLIKNIVFGTIAKLVGEQIAMRLFSYVVGRFPWWVRWVGPVSWSLSFSWMAFDLQGPAYRKTIPIVLYLGLCSLRDREASSPEEQG